MNIIQKRLTPIGYTTSLARVKRKCCKTTEQMEQSHHSHMEDTAVDAAVGVVEVEDMEVVAMEDEITMGMSPTSGK